MVAVVTLSVILAVVIGVLILAAVMWARYKKRSEKYKAQSEKQRKEGETRGGDSFRSEGQQRPRREGAPPPPPPPPRTTSPPADARYTQCERVMCGENIKKARPDLVPRWVLTNHPDKGGDEEVFKKVWGCHEYMQEANNPKWKIDKCPA